MNASVWSTVLPAASTMLSTLSSAALANLTTTEPPDPIMPPISKCNYYINPESNVTVVFDFTNQYGGIPRNLLINLAAWICLLLLFVFLRNHAGNYGRLALVRKNDEESKWTQIFYAPDDVTVTCDVSAATTYSIHHPGSREEHQFDPDLFASADNLVDDSLVESERPCSWLKSLFTLTDDQFLRRCGSDAVQYLRFQRHLLCFVALITLVCIGIILPINFQGDLQGTEVDFGHTTISNLKGTDDRLWAHAVVVILFLPLGVYIMRRFSVGLRISASEQNSIEDCSCNEDLAKRTVMIRDIPQGYCSKELLLRHLSDAYPGVKVDNVEIARDVGKLTKIDAEQKRARSARIHCEKYQASHGSGKQMHPHAYGIISMWVCDTCCCASSSAVDALTFYKKEEINLRNQVSIEKGRVNAENIGIAFVTFNKAHQARQMFKDHQSHCCRSANLPSSSISNMLEPWKWSVLMAPPPEDIYWENLEHSRHRFIIKAVVINVVLFLFIFFFSSPAYILSQMELIFNYKSITSSLHLPEKINDFLPTSILWTLSALLPNLVAYSDWWLGHWRRSVENLWIMRKVFWFLMFMALILPSIGFTTLRGMFEFFIHSSSDTMQWNCIFLPDNGAFFVNYVITSALCGTALELIRFPEVFMYAARMAFARSDAETSSIRKANLYEFPFGFNYGWMLLIFAMTVAYSVVCPLIAPFGLFYLLMKHLVDRYNIFFAYKRSKINKNIHATAVNFVIVSLLIQQAILIFFNVIRGQKGDANSHMLSVRALFSIVILIIASLLFFGQIFFHVFRGISPIQYVQKEETNEHGQHQHQQPISLSGFSCNHLEPSKYLPAVLRSDPLATSVASSSQLAEMIQSVESDTDANLNMDMELNSEDDCTFKYSAPVDTWARGRPAYGSTRNMN